MSPVGRVDSVVIDSDVTNYTLSSLFPATEYEISLNAVRGSQESKVVTTSVFTGTVGAKKHYSDHIANRRARQPDKLHLCIYTIYITLTHTHICLVIHLPD